MNRPNPSLTVFLLCQIGFVAAMVLTFDRLPERVAAHFDAAGQANRWVYRTSHIWMTGALGVGLSALTLGIFYSIRFFPPSMINLPRRDYWLGAERREETLGWVFRAGVWLASAEVLFMLGLHLLVVSANEASPPHLSSGAWFLAGLFVAFIIVWIGVLFRRFNRVA